jgi:hypothetical protein
MGTYAAALAFGVLGDAEGRVHWIDITRSIIPSATWFESADNVTRLALDALLLLHQDDPEGASTALALEPELAGGPDPAPR